MDAKADRTSPDRTRFAWLVRSNVLAMVMLGHLALLAILLRPPTPARPSSRGHLGEIRGAIEVRFVPVTQPSAITAAPSAAPMRRMPRSVHARVAPRAAIPIPQNATTSSAASTLPPFADGTPGYVPGGPGLGNAPAWPTSPAKRVPGGVVNGAPRFRMVDPRSQGVGVTLVRIIGGFSGAVDPHCVDVDTWGAMTEQERITHHVSGEDMTRIATEYGCRPPPPAVTR
jgi:hypothetical protein